MSTIELIQSLPKKRCYLQLARLKYFPKSPIIDILKEYENCTSDFGRYYCTALIYLLSFVLSKREFDTVLKDANLVSSWQGLKNIYQAYLKENEIEFRGGTHDVPDSITTARFKRILKKKKYEDIIVWGAGDYYKEMENIFEGVNIRYQIDDEDNYSVSKLISSPDLLSTINNHLPIFICSERKHEIRKEMIDKFPNYKGQVFV